MHSTGCDTDLERLLEVFKIEQFAKCLSFQLKQWILAKKSSSFKETARLVDEYSVLHNSEISFKQRNYQGSFSFKSNKYDGNFESGRKGERNSSGNFRDTPKSYSGWSPKSPKLTRNFGDKFGSQIHCNYCKSS